jgi:hypothetical protein
VAVTLLLVLLSAEPVVVDHCNGVEVIGPEETAGRIARIICGRKGKLDLLFGMKSRVRVKICEDMECWRRSSGRPWYIVAALVGEAEILTQPPGSLQKVDDLGGVLAHELVHLLIRKAAGRNCPRWLDEGLAQWLSGQKSLAESRRPKNEKELSDLERRLKSPKTTRDQLERDYASCRSLVKMLVEQVGEKALVRSLSGLKKIPAALDLEVRGLSLRSLLFPG